MDLAQGRNHNDLFSLRYVPTMLRDVPFSALYWPAYEACKAVLLPASTTRTEVFLGTFASGAIAGSIAATATLPFDVIKTR